MNVASLQTSKTKVKNVASIGWFQQCIHRSRNEVFSEVKAITPQMAEAMLTNNPDNRGIKPAKLEQMVLDMREGRWSFNGEPIIVAKTGELNDGQHRLTALIRADATLPMLFVFGVERETRTTLDQGANRSPGDYLAMEGHPNANQVAAIARQLVAYEKAGGKSLGKASYISAAETLERVRSDDKALTTAARYGNTNIWRLKGLASGTVIGMCYYLFINIDANDGLAFMHQLTTGEDLHLGDPALTARNRLFQLDRKTRPNQMEIIMRAWNAYRERRELKLLPIRGQLPELV